MVPACARCRLADFALRERTVQKLIFLCGDLGFLDCMFSNNDPLDKLEFKKIQKVTSEVISGKWYFQPRSLLNNRIISSFEKSS